jgi:hypothetical protein
MTDIEGIYDELYNSGIDVFNMEFEKIKAASLCDAEGDRSIAIDNSKLDSDADLKTVLLHEQGHCETHTFYSVNTDELMRGKLERRADRFVAENKITKYDIARANRCEGLVEAWEFAEHFGVTVDYMKRLMNIHFQMEFMD